MPRDPRPTAVATPPGVPLARTGESPHGPMTDFDLHLFHEGTHLRLWERLGAHELERDGVRGTHFGVWAPNASYVSVVGDFNRWDRAAHPLRRRNDSGVWEVFVPGVGRGAVYKYHVASAAHAGYSADKADPFATHAEMPPATASVVWPIDYAWRDQDWMRSRASRNSVDAPISIYECHLGSWARVPEEGQRALQYRELAPRLIAHLQRHGFTHVEFLPIMEHPYFKSWGYQTTGYFAPTARLGRPQDFMFLIDELHRAGIGVILDWVPSHFPTDEHGLGYFDGTHLYEHADERQGFHPDWKTFIFNYGRHEVRSFLLSSALFWLEKYHADGLRVDAVASMLYLDYSRPDGQWVANERGGRENLGAIDFLKRLNTEVYARFPDVQTIAEESTAWPLVSRPVHDGGLGFGLKWDMGWMNDTLEYLKRDPLYRKHHQNQLTFRTMYQFSENYVLPLSHDEVVHLKGSLLKKMAGDEWQRFANLRLLLANQWASPGKKLLFMGGEIAQWGEWDEESSVEWHLAERPPHAGISRLVRELNRLYRDEPGLHAHDCRPEGFEWVNADNADESVVTFLRKGRLPEDTVACAFNYTPVPRTSYPIGVPHAGAWEEILNTDAGEFGGTGLGNLGRVSTDDAAYARFPCTLRVTLPPLSAVWFRPARG